MRSAAPFAAVMTPLRGQQQRGDRMQVEQLARPARIGRQTGEDFFNEGRHSSGAALRNRQAGKSLDSAASKLCERRAIRAPVARTGV